MRFFRPLILLPFVASSCAGAEIRENSYRVEYTEILLMVPLTIDLKAQVVILSDYGIDGVFCQGAQKFCLTEPFVTAVASDLDLLIEWANESNWTVTWERNGEFNSGARLIATNEADGLSWVSIFENNDDEPLVIYSAKADEFGMFSPIGPIYVKREAD